MLLPAARDHARRKDGRPAPRPDRDRRERRAEPRHGPLRLRLRHRHRDRRPQLAADAAMPPARRRPAASEPARAGDRVARAGIGLHPLDPASPDDTAWLRALVWADHPGRATLLGGALTAAAARPPVPLHAGDAAERLLAVMGSVPAGMTVCLFHTAFLAHLPHSTGSASSTWWLSYRWPGRSTGCKPNPASTRPSPGCG
jgi:hypothetical protein